MRANANVSKLPSSYIREILKAATAKDCISLAGGLPSEKLLPFEHIAQSLRETADDINILKQILQYGPTDGYPPLLTYLRTTFKLGTDTRLLMTNGSQQGIDLVARGYLDCGDTVVMESPSYLGALQAFSLTPAEIKSIEQNADGPDLNQLEDQFKTGNCRIFYAVPDFHNPSGCCWSLATRQRVGELCQDYHVLLVEDAPYRELRFRGETLPMASTFCPENAIVLQSFSKTTAPGLRLGMLSGPAQLVAPLERIKQAADLHSNLPGQRLLLQLMDSDIYAQHHARLIQAYATQCESLCVLLDNKLGDIGQFERVDGGMFIWFQLHHLDGDRLAQIALKHGVAVVPGSVFCSDNNERIQRALRLNFSHPSEQDMETAIARLRASALEAMQNQ